MRAWWIASMLLLSVSIGRHAAADDYETAIARAAEARDRALESRSEEDWRRVLALFASAVELRPTMEARFEYAEAAARLGLTADACLAYQAALDLGLAGRAAERARRFLEENPPPREAAAPVPESAPATEAAPALTSHPPSSAPTRAPPSSGTPARGAGWRVPVLLAGSGVAVAGVATIIVTSLRLGSEREELARHCAVIEADECTATTAERVSKAQTIGNDILALKGLRWVGIGAAVLGAGAVTVSLVSLLGSDAGAERDGVSVSLGAQAANVSWRGSF